MRDGGEAVFACGPVGPAFDCGLGDFNSVTALTAHQVVVMFLALASTVSVPVALGAYHVDLAVAGHGLQRPVHGGQRDRFPVIAQHCVQMLGAAEVLCPLQHLVQGQALPGPPFHPR